MPFDWFTFIAQLINFLVLVWLLKRFLYIPILKAIDEREKRIALQLNEAETLKKAATEELSDFQRKNNEIDIHRQELLKNAISEADAEREKLLAKTRDDIEMLRSALQEKLLNDQQNLSAEIARRARHEVFSISRKALSDLASVNLESQMTAVFIDRINSMDVQEKKRLLSEMNKVTGHIKVRSALELPPNQKEAIENTLKTNFAVKTGIAYEVTGNTAGGIELIAGGYKIVWSIEDYLQSLEKSITEIVSFQSSPDAKS